MPKTISATEARVHFGEVMRQVSETQEPVIVQRAGKPSVAIVPMDDYERLQAMRDGKQQKDALDKLAVIGEKIRERRKAIDFPEPEDVIRQMREERSAEHSQIAVSLWHARGEFPTYGAVQRGMDVASCSGLAFDASGH